MTVSVDTGCMRSSTIQPAFCQFPQYMSFAIKYHQFCFADTLRPFWTSAGIIFQNSTQNLHFAKNIFCLTFTGFRVIFLHEIDIPNCYWFSEISRCSVATHRSFVAKCFETFENFLVTTNQDFIQEMWKSKNHTIFRIFRVFYVMSEYKTLFFDFLIVGNISRHIQYPRNREFGSYIRTFHTN